MTPEERQDMSLEPPAVQGAQSAEAVQQAQQGFSQQPPPGVSAADFVQQGQQPQGRPEARTAGEVNADLEALKSAKDRYEQSQDKKEDSPKSKDGYSEDDNEYESLWGDNDILNNVARRKRIEARCKKMSIDDYIMNGGISQTVPILPGKIEPTYRTAGTDEDLAVKRMMFGVQGTDIYVSNRFSLMQLTLSLFSFNNEPLPDHLDKDGKFDEDLFTKKFERVSKYPTQLAEDLVNNYVWFDERVKDMFNEEDLGNG